MKKWHLAITAALLCALLAGCGQSGGTVTQQPPAPDHPGVAVTGSLPPEQPGEPTPPEQESPEELPADTQPTVPTEPAVADPPVTEQPEQPIVPPAPPAAAPEKPVTPSPPVQEAFTDRTVMETVDLREEAVALSESPAALPDLLLPAASGTQEKRSTRAVIDYSHTQDGYVMVQHTAATTQRLKVQVKGPSTTYTYNLTPEQWEVFPLSDGSGSYQIAIYENVTGTKYALVLSVSCQVTLTDEFAPFLRPNQYVNYTDAANTVSMGAKLTAGHSEPLEKVEAVYDYVVQNLTYDKDRAATVKSGYLSDLDAVLREKKGICFDYAALMTAMLRSQGVPCKLVVGYAGTAYHAWISVWTEGDGWVDGVIYFDGHAWHRMDPTFASSGKQSTSIMAYIGDGANYTVKYLY